MKLNAGDFVITYPTTSKVNVNAGDAKVTIAPVKSNTNFTGDKMDVNFKILPQEISESQLYGKFYAFDENGDVIDFTTTNIYRFGYDGTEKTFKDIKFVPTTNTKKLVEGKDYEIKYFNNVTGPDAYVYINAIGNYTNATSQKFDGSEQTYATKSEVFHIDGVTVSRKDISISDTEYAGGVAVTPSQKVDVKPGTKVGTPVISGVKVVGNKATVILSGEADGASGYDYVISKANDTTTARVDVTKNQVKTTGDFNYVQQGTYYAYCHAWTRNAEGKKVFGEWSNIYPFSVSAITPAQPVITSVKAKGTTVTVTYTKAANAEGYDVVLGSAAKKVNGEYRPVSYGKLVKKNIKGNVVTATFKNVKKGTYYAGLHAFNKTSEDGKKVFSQWSNVKKVTVK